nr:hypothetical protein CFP56_43862 [Quercus suber]
MLCCRVEKLSGNRFSSKSSSALTMMTNRRDDDRISEREVDVVCVRKRTVKSRRDVTIFRGSRCLDMHATDARERNTILHAPASKTDQEGLCVLMMELDTGIHLS